MRISISGSHSTGKTMLATLCFKTIEKKQSISLIEEVAREVIALGYPLNKDATLDSYIHYILFQLERERKSCSSIVISDRSLVDLLAYIRVNDNKNIPPYFIKMLEEILWYETKYFNMYCYLPIEFPMITDGVRPEDEVYRSLVSNELLKILKEFNLHYVEITGTINERCRKVLKLLRV